MQTAGRAVVFSGTTVAIGLLALVALPLPFLRSVGYGGMLIPLISVLVAMTLLPVVLSKLGPRLDWPHVRNDDKASRSWTGWAELVVRGRWIAVLGASLVLAALVLAATNLQLGISNVNTIAKEGDAKQGLRRARALGHRLRRDRAQRGARQRVRLARARGPGARGRARRARSGRAGPAAVAAPGRGGGRRLLDPRRLIRGGSRHARPRALGRARGRPGSPPRRAGGPERGLHQRRVRQLPADDRADRADHVRAARASVPLAAAAAEGGGAERDQRRRRLGRARARVAAAATART